ncbi:MAG: hypothetical protein MUE97_01035 [Phycisphaerales bacterium]|nr:hypothetical protein [Phycisphaerales bacterium]
MPLSPRHLADLPIDQWPHAITIEPLTAPPSLRPSTIRPPGSKSLTNRALLLAALAHGDSTLTGALLDADDAQVMLRALRALGAQIDITPELDAHTGAPTANATIRITGVHGRWRTAGPAPITLALNNAGTATRFLTAAAILQPPTSPGIIIDGNARMRQRPIAELVSALNALTDRAPRVTHLGAEGYPPVLVPPMAIESISARAQPFGRTSSGQFISALLLIAPFLPQGLELAFTDAPTSPSYIQMTAALLARLGVPIDGHIRAASTLRIAPHTLRGFTLDIEPDASGATYFHAAEALLNHAWGQSPTTTESAWDKSPTCPESLQGDAAFADIARAWRADPLDLDMADMPDAAMTAAVLAAFSDGTSTLRGLRTLRVKETDRLGALVNELAKLNIVAQPFTHTNAQGQPDEGLTITPPLLPTGRRGINCTPAASPVEFDTYDDHRMAMSLALIGLLRPNITIRDPACVRKTYPTYWRDLARVQ